MREGTVRHTGHTPYVEARDKKPIDPSLPPPSDDHSDPANNEYFAALYEYQKRARLP